MQYTLVYIFIIVRDVINPDSEFHRAVQFQVTLTIATQLTFVIVQVYIVQYSVCLYFCNVILV